MKLLNELYTVNQQAETLNVCRHHEHMNSEVNEFSACSVGIQKCNHTKDGTSNNSETPSSSPLPHS